MRRRPRSVWFALGTGVIVTVIVATVVLVPVIGLVASAAAAIARACTGVSST